MSEERNNVGMPCITKIAKEFNSLESNDVKKGVKTAKILEGQIYEGEKAYARALKNAKETETPVPTGSEIMEDYQEGEYR